MKLKEFIEMMERTYTNNKSIRPLDTDNQKSKALFRNRFIINPNVSQDMFGLAYCIAKLKHDVPNWRKL